ncbi:ATP-binding protein [Metabacillus halosaccharovorans]|uniref:sensor histidine kinase n=1 Tax=Metabacillus halosaccharovorans TaxID=930124 RepID=UPI0034CFF04A
MRKLLKHMSFRAKILSILLILTFLLSGFSYILVQSIEAVKEVSNKIEEKNVPEVYWLTQWDKDLAVRELVVKEYLGENLCCDFVEVYQSYQYEEENETSDPPPAVPSSLISIKKGIELLDFMVINNIQGLLAYEEYDEARTFIRSVYLPQLEELRTEINEAKELVFTKFTAHSDEFSSIISNALWLLISITIVAICLSIIAAYRISANLTKPIETMADKVDLIARGQYGLTLPPLKQVEFEELANSINQMSKSLKDSFTTILNDKMYREQIVNSLPIGIITINDELSELKINRAAADILQYNEDIISKFMNEQIYDENEQFWNILTLDSNFHHRKITYKTAKENKVLLVSQTGMHDHQCQIIGRMINFVDMTETEELEKRMYQSEKLAIVGEIAAGAAHEIRNPLAVVQGFLSLMNQSLGDKEKNQYHMALLMKELERINSIIEEMLLLSKPGAPIKKEVCLQSVLEEFLPLIIDSSEDITIHINLIHRTVPIDSKQMKQVFHNLVRNSIEAMRGQGEIRIYSQVSDNYFQIYVKDNGPGIPYDLKEKIFDPFTSSKEDGTGLGLMIVKRIVENHDGHISVHETSSDGTIFLIELPL